MIPKKIVYGLLSCLDHRFPWLGKLRSHIGFITIPFDYYSPLWNKNNGRAMAMINMKLVGRRSSSCPPKVLNVAVVARWPSVKVPHTRRGEEKSFYIAFLNCCGSWSLLLSSHSLSSSSLLHPAIQRRRRTNDAAAAPAWEMHSSSYK